MNAVALYDTLNCLSYAVLLLEGGTPERVARGEASLLEASVAAPGAFPQGTPESDALNVLLSVVQRMDRVAEGATS